MTSETQLIWAEFGDRLRAFIARRVENDADADDLLQEVFLRIHRHAGTVEHADRLTSWLFQVTRNAIADYHRAPARRRELPSGVADDLEFGRADAAAEIDDADLASPLVRQELALCLRPMVDRLPTPYREAIALVDLDGVTHHEAADRAGLSLSGMKSRVQRGRRALKEMLDACCLFELDAGGRLTDYRTRGAGCTSAPNRCGQGGCGSAS
jgi:RNA polymerase sigma-70 factor (ECF subfamily)